MKGKNNFRLLNKRINSGVFELEELLEIREFLKTFSLHKMAKENKSLKIKDLNFVGLK